MTARRYGYEDAAREIQDLTDAKEEGCHGGGAGRAGDDVALCGRASASPVAGAMVARGLHADRGTSQPEALRVMAELAL
jgi:hypothetical protein